MSKPIRPLFSLPALDPEFTTSDEWLVYWTKSEWNHPDTFRVTHHFLSTALRFVDDERERIKLIATYSWLLDPKLAYGSMLQLYTCENPMFIPRIPEIDAYHDERLAQYGVS